MTRKDIYLLSFTWEELDSIQWMCERMLANPAYDDMEANRKYWQALIERIDKQFENPWED